MTGVKYDGEKPKMHLLPPKAITEVAKVLTFGAQKYDEENWRKLDNLQARYSSGALRHIFAHLDRESLDPESGLSHLAHAICCLLFKLEIELEESKEAETREHNRYEPPAGHGYVGPNEWSVSYNKEGSMRDSEYSIQYSKTDPSSGGF